MTKITGHKLIEKIPMIASDVMDETHKVGCLIHIVHSQLIYNNTETSFDDLPIHIKNMLADVAPKLVGGQMIKNIRTDANTLVTVFPRCYIQQAQLAHKYIINEDGAF